MFLKILCLLTIVFINCVVCRLVPRNFVNYKEKSHSASIAGMVHLLNVEQNLLTNLQNYANLLKKRLSVLQFLKFRTNETKYGLNPLNKFSLMHFMHKDCPKIISFLSQTVGNAQLKFMRNLKPALPTRMDLQEATSAIIRIQKNYELIPNEIASGLLNGHQYDAELKSLECFAIGLHLYKKEKFYDAAQWLSLALNLFASKYKSFYELLGLKRFQILQFYLKALYKDKRFSEALTILENALSYQPRNTFLLNLKSKIEVASKRNWFRPTIAFSPYTAEYYEAFNQGCRGEFKTLSKFHCRFATTAAPFLRIAPYKMEQLSVDPYIILIYEFISEKEMNILKTLSLPQLQRGMVGESRSSVITGRTSKDFDFTDNNSPIGARINQRIRDMTNLDERESDLLQVINYGIGGHYVPHTDYFINDDYKDPHGTRIATLLFYLSNVEQGGATVFPLLKIANFPQKGSALFWYNLDNAGYGNINTIHGACPTIFGSKWVATKWIRERSQIFRKPCLKK